MWIVSMENHRNTTGLDERVLDAPRTRTQTRYHEGLDLKRIAPLCLISTFKRKNKKTTQVF